MQPDVLAAELKAKVFTNGADRTFVIDKYAITYEDVISSAEVLVFANLNWGDAEIGQFVMCLRDCVRLKSSRIPGNDIGDRGWSLLADALPECTHLEDLWLMNNKISVAGV